MINYIANSYKVKIGNTYVNVTNLTPIFSAKENKSIKIQIEQKLYEVFCKYASSHICEK